MSLVSKTLSGLYNGVSQQAPPIRAESQAEEQINISSSLTKGILQRPNTTFISELSSTYSQNVFIHTIDRDKEEKYILIFTGDPVEPLEIYTFEGDICSLSYEAPHIDKQQSYFSKVEDGETDLINPKKALKLTTIGDNTIVVNKNRYVRMDSNSQPAQTLSDGSLIEDTTLIYVPKGYPETDYNVRVETPTDTYNYSYSTPAPSSANVQHIKTNTIAQALSAGLTDTLPAEFDVRVTGNEVIVRNSEDYTLTVSDSFGNQAFYAIRGSVQTMDKLPPVAPEGYVVRVMGKSNTENDAYYVKFVSDEYNPSGVWEETTALRNTDGDYMVNRIDPDTMPLKIERTAPKTFAVKRINWEPRRVGNNISAPYPSFVDSKINDVFFFQNRIGLLSGESVILSRSGDYFNFFNATGADVLDTDPIDVTVSTRQITGLENAIPYARTLLMFSKKVQFILNSGDNPLTPMTVAIDPSTYFDNDTDVEPVGAGANIYFKVPYGRYTSIREYFVQENARLNDATNITSHVPNYLPATIDRLTANSARDLLVASDSNSNEMYIYKYFWDNQKKVQSAWSKWELPEVEAILDIVLIESFMFLVILREGKMELLKIELEDKQTGTLPFRIFLDYLVEATGTYDEVTKKTTWNLPYNLTSDKYEIVDSETGLSIGEQKTQESSNQVSVIGDFSDKPYFIGIKYKATYEFSKFYIRDNQGRPQLNGRVQVRNITLTFTDTASFTIISETNGNRINTKKYNGIVLGETKLGTPSFISGEEKFPVMAKTGQVSIRLESDSYLPFKIHTASFEADFTSRSKYL